jgi:hypothetical protein
MKLKHDLHLAYCTNIHRGESWLEIFDALKRYTLPVRHRVSPGKPYAIGLRLGECAARELSDSAALLEFQHWLDQNDCYIFTINGFPFGQFHRTRVKEQVYLPDWTSRDRLSYTKCLFDLLAKLVPAGVEGSVSTVPCGFKGILTTNDQLERVRNNLWSCVEHISSLSAKTGKTLHLGLEPEPLCVLETSAETVRFFEQMQTEHPDDPRLAKHLGVNYDACHLAVEFEEPSAAISALLKANIKLSKIHLSSALKVRPSTETLQALESFTDEVYLHQTVVQRSDGTLVRYTDLPEAVSSEKNSVSAAASEPRSVEWRIHFHIPLHSPPTKLLDTTSNHLLGVLDLLQANPKLCSHLEMETYTWEVLPPALKNRDVVEQLVAEYDWTLARMAERGLTELVPANPGKAAFDP